jgi:hypothetical protein
MELLRRAFVRLALGGAICPIVLRIAEAGDYPTRPITVIVPFAAGGPLDTLMRIVTDRMREFLGQSVVVENVTGAAGTIGVGRVARAAPDGYTLIAGIWSTHVVNGVVYKLSYDVLKDFAAVALLTDNAQVIVARKSMPASIGTKQSSSLQTSRCGSPASGSLFIPTRRGSSSSGGSRLRTDALEASAIRSRSTFSASRIIARTVGTAAASSSGESRSERACAPSCERSRDTCR